MAKRYTLQQKCLKGRIGTCMLGTRWECQKQQSPTTAKCLWMHLASPSSERKKLRGVAPLGDGGTDPPNFFQSHDLEYWWNMRKITFFVPKNSGGGVPPTYPYHTQKFHIPTLPIHHDISRELWWRLRGATLGQNLAENDEVQPQQKCHGKRCSTYRHAILVRPGGTKFSPWLHCIQFLLSV